VACPPFSPTSSNLFCRKRKLSNLTIITADLVDFQAPKPGSYDRVVSVECFEHMKVRRGRQPASAEQPAGSELA
jgi:hypothetical protein